MKYIAAYALLALNQETITTDDLTNFLTGMGVEVDQKPVEQIVNSLKGVPLNQAIEQGLAKISTMNIGGGSNNNVVVADAEEDKEDEVSEDEADVSMAGFFSSD